MQDNTARICHSISPSLLFIGPYSCRAFQALESLNWSDKPQETGGDRLRGAALFLHDQSSFAS